MKIFYVLILVSLGLYAGAQTIADFENYDLQQDTFDNGSDGNGGFNSGGIFIPNLYDPGFDSWTGWSISTMRDTVTPGFFNQYSCIAAQEHRALIHTRLAIFSRPQSYVLNPGRAL